MLSRFKHMFGGDIKLIDVINELVNYRKKYIQFNKKIIVFFFAAELKMNALREREINNSLERRLSEEQKMRGCSIFFYFIHLSVQMPC